MSAYTLNGKRLGAVLGYACAYRRDVGALLAEIRRLRRYRGVADGGEPTGWIDKEERE